jgi:hypothetical protein
VWCRRGKGSAWQGRIGEDRTGCVVHYVMQTLEVQSAERAESTIYSQLTVTYSTRAVA